MDHEHACAHLRLWTDVVRHAPLRTCPHLRRCWLLPPGSRATANVAVQRALAANPEYSMALLLLEALSAGAPPSAARLPMTLPEEVAASYAHTLADLADYWNTRTGRRGPAQHPSPARPGSHDSQP
jgi:Domain of unknown function (DUF4192)